MTITQISLAEYLRPTDRDRRMIKDLPLTEQPEIRMQTVGPRAMTDAELLSLLIRTPDGLDRATDFLARHNELPRMANMSLLQMQRELTEKSAFAVLAGLELGRRAMMRDRGQLPKISSPADAANLLMPEMQDYEQEHLIVVPLDTRNNVLGIVDVYKGSLNTSVVRVGELFKSAITMNAAAIIIAHNHPSGDPSPSAEDVRVTRQVVEAGSLMDIDVLDHVVIGRQRYVSLKERGLGFS